VIQFALIPCLGSDYIRFLFLQCRMNVSSRVSRRFFRLKLVRAIQPAHRLPLLGERSAKPVPPLAATMKLE